MSSTRPKRGKAAATSKSAAKAKDDDKPFKFNPNEYESDVTDDDGDDDEYGVDAIKYAWYQNTEGDKGWRYGVMWKGYLKSTSDTVEPLTSFNEDDNGRIPFIDDFWKEVADRPLMRGTHEPLSGRVDEILETPKALLEEWLDKCRPRRDYKAYRRRRRAEKNDDPITKGMSDYYINHGSLVRYRKRQAEKAAGRKYEGSDSDEPKNRKIDERPKKKAREGDMGPPAPVQPKPEPPKPEPPKKRSTPPDDIPYSGPFGQSAEAGPSVRRKVSPTASLDSLFDERSSQEAGSRASSQVQAPPPKRRRVVDTSPEPVSKADQVSRAADRADKMSKMGKIKKQLPSDPSTPTDVTSNGPIPASAPAATPSFGELNPDIFGTPVASPAMPPPSIPSPAMPSPAMPSPAQSPYIPPSAAAQERSQNPLFDFGNTSGRSPTESEIDIDESITVKAEDGAAPDNAAQEAPIPPQPEAAPSAEEPMAVEEEDVSAPQTTAPPEATAITAVPSPVEADTAQTTSPDAAAAPLPTSETTGSPPPDKVTPVENGSASAATLGSSSTISVPASGGLPAKPTATTGDAGGSKPTSVITPSQRGKYVQPKKVKVLEFPGAAEANPQSRRLLSKLSTKPVSGSAGPPSAGPSSAASGPPSGVSPTVGVAPRPPAGFLTGSGSRWKNTPAAQAVAASAKAPSANYVPRNTLAGGVSPVIPHPGGLSPLEQRGGPGGRSPHDALGGGRSPYDPRAGGRSPHDPRAGGRSPHDPRAGGRSPHDQQRGDVRPPNPYSNRSPMAGNRSPVYGSSNTLMSTVTGAAGNQRVNGASGWGSGSAVPAHPSNGNRSPTWAQPAAGTARPTRPPAVRPAVVDPTRDPRRRPAGGTGSSANPIASAAGVPPAMRPPSSTAPQPQPQPLGDLSVAIIGHEKESHRLKISRGFTTNTSGIFSLSQYLGDARTTLLVENDRACLDMAFNQGASVREWAQVDPSTSRHWESSRTAAGLHRGDKIFVLRDELKPVGAFRGHGMLVLARAQDAHIDKVLGPFRLDQLNLVLLVLDFPVSGRALPSLPNPVSPDFEVAPHDPMSVANPTTILESYGLRDSVLSSFRGKSMAILPNLPGSKHYEIVKAAIQDSGVLPLPADGSPAEVALLLNGYWPQLLLSGTLQKCEQSNTTKFYCLGPDLQLPISYWPFREVWCNGALVVFSQHTILQEPDKVRGLMKKVRSVDNWAAYITPLSLLYINEVMNVRRSCPDKNETFALLSESLFTNEDLSPLAGERTPESGGLAVSQALPSLERPKLCSDWLDWQRQVSQCKNYGAMIELCEQWVKDTGGRALRSGGMSPTKAGGSLDPFFVDEQSILDLADMRSRPEFVPYRRFIHVGKIAPGLDQKHQNRVEFLKLDDLDWVFANSL